MPKINGLSLAEIIGEKKSKYEASVITTYNVYLPFYEQIILAHLRKAGCRANTLLVDAGQYTKSFTSEHFKPQTAGRDYSLLPISSHGGVFHPKIMLLAGKEKVSFCIGSHNLTLSGFGKNRELTVWHQITPASSNEDVYLFQQIWKSIRAWVIDQPPEMLQSLAFIEDLIPWAFETDFDVSQESNSKMAYFATYDSNSSLWSQVRKILPENVRRVSLIAPFFGEQLSFLETIQKDLSPQEFVVGVEPGSVQITHDAHLKTPFVKYVGADSLNNGKGYLHAKGMLIETTDNREYLIIGSANASRSAWLGENGYRNYEAVTVIERDKKQSLATDLGLSDLHQLLALTSADWQSIKESQQKIEDETTVEKRRIYQAIALTDKFKITVSDQDLKITALKILDRANQTIGKAESISYEENIVFAHVSSPMMIQNAWALEYKDAWDRVGLAYVHHPVDIARTLRTGKLQELCTALESIDTGINENLIKLIEQFVFDESDLIVNSEASMRETAAGAAFRLKESASDEEQIQNSFSIPTALNKNSNAQSQFQSDSLSELLSFINRQLYSTTDSSEPTLNYHSEEELIDSEDETVVKAIDKREEFIQLATTSRKKTKTMMTRMCNKMKSIAPGNAAGAYIIFRQLMTVLSFLCLLKQHEKKISTELKGETFIDADAEWDFFLDITFYLFSSRHRILENALKYIGKNSLHLYHELIWLLLWLAFDVNYNIDLFARLGKMNQGDVTETGYETQHIVHGGARLLSIAEHSDFLFETNTEIPSYFKGEREQIWLDSHNDWLLKAYIISTDSDSHIVQSHAPRTGDFIKALTGNIHLVLDNSGNVLVVNVDSETTESRFSRDYVQVLQF